jgi:hypothetical protein
MASALNRDSKLALLLSRETSLAHWLNPAIGIDIPLKSLNVAVIEVQIWITFKSFHIVLSFVTSILLKWDFV